MEELSGASYNLHTAKCWKKNKGKRLVRSIAKKNRASDRRDNATIALYVVADEEDDSVEIARQRQEMEDRRDRNKKWREQKEFKESGKEAPKKKKKIDKNTRNRMVDKELRCRNCRDNLDKEVWECPNGHGFCGDCVDTNRINETEGNLEQGSDGVFRNKDFSSLRRILNNDNNEDTLWLVTHGEGQGESEKTGENEEEDTLWKFKKDEEEDSLPPYDISVELIPKTYSEIELGDNEENEELAKEKYNSDLQKNIQTIEFFENETEVRKEVIGAYGDYNRDYKNIFESYSIDEDEWNKGYQVLSEENNDGSTDGDSSHYNSSSDYSTDTELEISPVSQCPVCNLDINTRNSEIERIAVIFNKMMGHRMKI